METVKKVFREVFGSPGHFGRFVPKGERESPTNKTVFKSSQQDGNFLKNKRAIVKFYKKYFVYFA